MAAGLLSVNPLTIRRWIKRGYVKAYRVGPKLTRIPITEISRLRTIRIKADDDATRPNYPAV